LDGTAKDEVTVLIRVHAVPSVEYSHENVDAVLVNLAQYTGAGYDVVIPVVVPVACKILLLKAMAAALGTRHSNILNFVVEKTWAVTVEVLAGASLIWTPPKPVLERMETLAMIYPVPVSSLYKNKDCSSPLDARFWTGIPVRETDRVLALMVTVGIEDVAVVNPNAFRQLFAPHSTPKERVVSHTWLITLQIVLAEHPVVNP
jgi:hypothetical protein